MMTSMNTTDTPEIAKACPQCGQRLTLRRNRSSGEPFLGCSRWRECDHTETLPLDLQKRASGDPVLPGFE